MTGTVLIFDTETTGLPSTSFAPEIVQIGAILQDMDSGRIHQELNLLVKLDGDMPDDCLAIHGISRDMANGYGLTKVVADNILATLAGYADTIVAHNLSFDMQIIKGVWPVSAAIMTDKPKVCTMQLCSRIANIPRRHANKNQYTKLIDAYTYFYGREFDGAHDALSDTRACRDVLLALMERKLV